MSHNKLNRIVVLIDMDCFYVQVEQRRNTEKRGKPCAVVQYNQWKGGGIIAVGYEARAKGVTRQMRGDDAKEKCPDIVLFQVPTANGKADLTRYREAGAEVIEVLLQFGGIVERASIDEAYIELTSMVDERISAAKTFSEVLPTPSALKNTHVVGWPKETQSIDTDLRSRGIEEYSANANDDEQAARLCIAASIVEEMRLAIYEQTSFRCSAGVSHNKMLSKLACGINKPNQQTVLPFDGVHDLFKKTKLNKISLLCVVQVKSRANNLQFKSERKTRRNLGGKLGASVTEEYGVEFIGQITEIDKSCLISKYGSKTGQWLHDLSRGIDHEPVKERHVVQSVGCSKNFTGAEALNSRKKVEHWVRCLVAELVERLTKDMHKNNRVAKSLTIHVGYQSRKTVSRTCHIDQYDEEHVVKSCLATLEKLNEKHKSSSDLWSPSITMLGISSKNFKESCTEGYANVASLLTSAKFDTSLEKLTKKQENKSTVHSEIHVSPARRTAAPEQPLERFFQPVTPESRAGKAPASTATKTGKSALKSLFTDRAERSRGTLESFLKPIPSQARQEDSPPQGKILHKEESEIVGSDVDITSDTFVGEASSSRLTKKTAQVVDTSCSKPSRSPSNNKLSKAIEVADLTKPSRKAYTDFTYLMSDLDEDVLKALPLSIQQEVKNSCSSQSVERHEENQSSPSKYRKRQSKSPTSNQHSIAKFMRPLHNVQNLSKASAGDVKTKSGKVNRKKKSVTSADISKSTSVPLGFFRTRFQASAAIRNAVAKQCELVNNSEKRAKEENAANNSTEILPSSEKLPLSSQRIEESGASASLWSSAIDTEPAYKCPECNAMVPISRVSSHSDYHEKLTEQPERRP